MSYFSYGTLLEGTVLHSPLTSSVLIKSLAVPSICCHPSALIIFNPFSFNTFFLSSPNLLFSLYFLSSIFCFYLHAFQSLSYFSAIIVCFSLPPHQQISEENAILYHVYFLMLWECVHLFFFFIWQQEWSCALVAFPMLVCGWTDRVCCSSWRWLTTTAAKETTGTTGFPRFG